MSFLDKLKNQPYPSWKQLKCLPKVMPMRERWISRLLFATIIAAVGFLIFNSYINSTQTIPEIGGQYREGMIGQPRYINPVLALTNDIDRDLVKLIYSGLFEYDGAGNLIPDLAESYQIEDDGLSYIVSLKNNVFWHNGEKFTAEDVIFTVKTIQDQEYKSPARTNWQGVETEKLDDATVKFKLNNPYAPFLHNLTIAIMPKHLWAGISAQNFPLAEYNLRPIGSGPYRFEDIIMNKDGHVQTLKLSRDENFYGRGPFIENIVFQFYNNQEEVKTALQKRQIDGFGSFANANRLTQSNIVDHAIAIPAYYAVFFNQTQSKPLADKIVRQALNYATDKNAIIEQVLQKNGQAVESPLLPDWLGYSTTTPKYDFALEHARNILEAAGWTDQDSDGIREKKIQNEDVKLEFTLIATDWPEFQQTAALLKEQWEKIGARINLENIDPLTVQQEYLRPRGYQALLFGQVLGADPDPFAFWHSSQKKDPGLNLALYQNQTADKLLEEIRKTMDNDERTQKFLTFQKTVIDDAPAVFLYSPFYFYQVDKKIKGIAIKKLAQPAQRFSQIEDWYIETKRIPKENASQ